jgi:hypothetical protein
MLLINSLNSYAQYWLTNLENMQRCLNVRETSHELRVLLLLISLWTHWLDIRYFLCGLSLDAGDCCHLG